MFETVVNHKLGLCPRRISLIPLLLLDGALSNNESIILWECVLESSWDENPRKQTSDETPKKSMRKRTAFKRWFTLCHVLALHLFQWCFV
ncbi:hypothetical protein DNTS_033872 [Danionella cerebrum]|uniref:Uncharacterized protein n=1 Tax=Danionella cerebrum TaxID=2873325 RepID=A0A553NGK2_9TELE|nr:hypothetical protein DNTS_033872 [Danionella translucida]